MRYIVTGSIYRHIIKPIFFLFPADTVHHLFLRTGRILGAYPLMRRVVSVLWRYDSPMLVQDVAGMHMQNPIGLSAGFDYNADLVQILPSVGFGFHTIGTLTAESYEGNPPPMLGRLPKSKSLLVNKGFKNDGVVSVLDQVPSQSGASMRGVSVGATNKPYADFASMIANLVEGFRLADRYDTFDYFELNISCPNLLNTRNLNGSLASVDGLRQTLELLAPLGISRPVFIKMPLERTVDEMDALIAVAVPYGFVRGFVFANLAKDRSNPAFDTCEIAAAGVGNFSGKPLAAQSTELLRHGYERYHARFVFVGVGGVFSAEDAYDRICAGASLVQLITGMVYEGPQQIGAINRGIARLLARDGYRHISEAIGTKTRPNAQNPL